MNYLVMNQGPNRAQRNAAIHGDKTKGHGGGPSYKGGNIMRARAEKRMELIMKGRDLMHKLFLRSGINLHI